MDIGANDHPPVATGTEPANPSVDPSLTNLENVVAAAKVEAAAVKSPAGQFTAQFGVKPSVTEAPIAADPNLADVRPLAETPTVPPDPSINPTAEAVSQPEDPQATFVQDIKAAVEKLEKTTKEKVPA